MKTNKSKVGLAAIMLLMVVGLAMATTPVQAYQELTATWQNTNSLTAMTYWQSPYLAWAPYYTTAGVYKGYLLKWDYASWLDPTNKKALSINSYYGTIKGVNMADPNGYYYGECVSFVKSVAHSTLGTSKWIRGRNVLSSVQNKPIDRGAAIATFKSDGTYDSWGTTGKNHVAIFDRYYYENGVLKGIVVWDQNYVYGCINCGQGLIGYHVIPTTNSGTGAPTDAASYYVVVTDNTGFV